MMGNSDSSNMAENADPDEENSLSKNMDDLNTERTDIGQNQESSPNIKATSSTSSRIIKAARRLFSRDGTKHVTFKLSRRLTPDEVKLATEYIQKFMERFCCERGSNIYEYLSENASAVDLESGAVIIEKGDPSSGLYVLITGTASLTTYDGDETIATISAGEVLGELSTFYDTPCSARVQASTSCVLGHLEKKCALDFIGQPKYDEIDWCVRMKYLPTRSDVDSGRIYRRATLSYLKEIPAFQEWPELAIKTLILLLGNPPVIIYGLASTIVMETDPGGVLYIFLRGRLTVNCGQRQIASFTITSESKAFVFGERALLMDDGSVNNNCAAVTITALSCCHVIQIRREQLAEVMDKFADAGFVWDNRWLMMNNILQGWGSFYRRYPADLQPEIVWYQLMCSPRLNHMTRLSIERLLQHAKLTQLYEGQNLDDAKGIYDLVYMVRGDLEIVHQSDEDTTTVSNLTDGQILDLTDRLNQGTALCSSVVLLFKDVQEEETRQRTKRA